MMGKFIVGDCLEVMKTLEPVDLIFFDPPYNRKKKYDSYDDNMEESDYWKWMAEVLLESRKLSRRGVVVFIDGRLLQGYWSLMQGGHPIVVHKRAAGINVRGFACQYHIVLADATPLSRCPDLWNDIRLPGEGYFFREQRYDNPGLTGLELTKRVVELFTEEGETVLDPFMGSGTTAEACVSLGRDFIGIDLSQNYCDMATERIKAWETS